MSPMRLHPFTTFGPRIEASVIQEDVLQGLPFEVQMVNQVHGTAILEVDKYASNEEGHDAMICTRPGLRLLIKTADCIPLVLADEESGVIAAVHAGWRSLVADIIPKTIAAMLAKGAEASRIKVGLGPSLGTECAEFSHPKEEIPAAYHWAINPENHVDLDGICQRQLSEAGIATEHIQKMAICTACDSEWPSWRRDKGQARMGTVIMIQD